MGQKTNRNGEERTGNRSSETGRNAAENSGRNRMTPERNANGQERTGHAQSNEQPGQTGARGVGTEMGRGAGGTEMTGSHGGTAGSVTISQEQRTRIHDVFVRDTTLIRQARVEHVDFDVRVGTRVPHRIHLHAVPRDIVEIVPQFRTYEFFVVREDIVIVDPHTLEIVDVINLA